MYNQSLHNSNNPSDSNLSSKKMKVTTPALLFCKSHKDSSSKLMSENNSSLINMNRSPMRMLNAKNNISMTKSPLLNRSNLIQKNFSGNMVFSKSRVSENQYQDMSIRESVHSCENHEGRTANFLSCIDETNLQYFCEKCAILIASQGYSVEKIAESSVLLESRKTQYPSDLMKHSMISQKSSKSSRASFLSQSKDISASSNARKIQIQNFLSMTRGLLDKIQYKKQETKQNLIQSQQFYGQQIQQVNEYFQLVYKSLQLQKNKCYNYILNQRVQVQRPIRLINDTISQLKQKIQGILEDIEQNIQTVYQTAHQIYRPVIQQYQDNYQDIESKLGQIQILEVQMRKIDFQGVPQSIFYLSDILKDSFEQNYKTQNKKKMSQQLDSLRQSLKDSLPQIQPRKLFSRRLQCQQDTGDRSNSKFVFSFEGQALHAQLQQQKIIYETDD